MVTDLEWSVETTQAQTIGRARRMDVLRPTTWLLSLGLHGALLVAFVGFAGDAALESGSGDDMVNVEQGIALEGLTKLGEAEQTIETVDVPPAQEKVEPQPVKEIKPEIADALTAKDSEHEERVVPDEIKPQEQKPVHVPTQQQAAQVATLIQQSSGAEQHGGDATEHRLYLGQLRKLLDKSKINPRAHQAGTVLVEFKIAPSGQLLSREIKQSSGSKLLDDAAVAALDRAAPFPPMPKSSSQEPLDVQVPFKFVTH
jgi:periplasmic protein TonB